MKWEMAKVIDKLLVTDFVANGSFASLKENVNYNYEPDYAILIRTTDKTKGWNGNYVYVNQDSYAFLSKSYLLPGDLIIANVGDPGKAFLCPDMGQPMTLGPNSILVRPLNPNEVNNKYYYYYTISKIGQEQIQEICSATAQKKFNKTSYRSIEFPLPPLSTQKKIAAILDEADKLRQLNKQLIQKYDALTQSLFLDMFGDPVTNPKGWEKKNLGELTSMITDGKHGNCNDENNSGYFFISAKDIFNDSINYKKSRQIPKVEFEEVDRRTDLQPGDLVMVNTGATIGKMAIAADIWETRRTTFQKSVAIIKTKSEFLAPTFLKYVFILRLDSFSGKGSGSAIKNLLLSEMRRFKIICAHINLQNHFAERVQAIEAQKALAQVALQKSEDLFNSLLQRAFKGELVKE